MWCGVCESAKENWLCLHCCKAFCSRLVVFISQFASNQLSFRASPRYVHGHMASHNSVTDHKIAVSFSDLSFWCYSCDSYIVHPVGASSRSSFTLEIFLINNSYLSFRRIWMQCLRTCISPSLARRPVRRRSLRRNCSLYKQVALF